MQSPFFLCVWVQSPFEYITLNFPSFFLRDLTINAFFYNINSGEIEDYTGQGIEDLKLGQIRTPLEPLVTLLDDPLRVLRAIRFACRFNFK
jgi:tRNA nucleotidyltransferase/poly(A) polymerase